jgi:hypothetical protein
MGQTVRTALLAVLLISSATGAKASDDFVLVSCVRSWLGPCAPLPSLRYLSPSECNAARETLKSQMGADNVRAACLAVDAQWNRALFPKE